jgi:hypothetical protein
MSYMPIDIFRQRRVRPSTGTQISARTFGLVLMFLFAFCSLGASAQNPTFTLTTNGPISVQAGHYGPFTVTATPTNGNVTGTMSLTCENLPLYSSCEFPGANSGVTMNNAPASDTISFNTSQVYNYETKSTPLHSTLGRVALCSLFAPAIGLLLLGRRRGVVGAGVLRVMLCLMVLCPLAGLAGCGNTKPLSTPTGSYTITIVGAFAATTESTTMVVNVTN